MSYFNAKMHQIRLQLGLTALHIPSGWMSRVVVIKGGGKERGEGKGEEGEEREETKGREDKGQIFCFPLLKPRSATARNCSYRCVLVMQD